MRGTIAPVPDLSNEAVELLTAQANVIATWQVEVPNSRAMARAHRRGHWQRVTSNVYAAGPAEPTEEQSMWAAALHFGAQSMLTGQAALKCHGWTGDRQTTIDVLVPRSVNPRHVPKGLRVHRTTVMPSRSGTGIPRALPASATVDAVSWARTDREADFLVVSVLQQKLCDAADLERALRDRPTTLRRKLILATVAEFQGGATTMGELDFKRLCHEYGIRQPDRQVWRKVGGRRRRLDCYWDAERVVVEIDGIGHLDVAQSADDQERQNDVVLSEGCIVLRVMNIVLRHDPGVFMAQLGVALGMDQAA
jgi:hypothetical protein